MLHINAPDYIQFYPTMRCNLSCEFCFNKNMPYADEMSHRDLQKFMKILSKLGIRTIDIMGGEPFLYTHIFDLLYTAKKANFSINLSTNGTFLEEINSALTEYPGLNLGISINDQLTLHHLKGIIKRCHPIVKSIFKKELDWEFFYEVLCSGTKKYYLIYPDTTNGATKDCIAFFEFYQWTLFLNKCFGIEGVYCSGFIPDTSQYPCLAHVRCPAGTTKLGIMPDGSVYPCNLFFGVEDFYLGNVLYEGFDKIWNSTKLDFFRTYLGNNCPEVSCKIKALCHGGCPYHSLLYYGMLDMPDPRCLNLTKK